MGNPDLDDDTRKLSEDLKRASSYLNLEDGSLGSDMAKYAKQQQELHAKRPKIRLIKHFAGCRLEYHYFLRKKKLVINGQTLEEVLLKFLKEHSEEMFGAEFEISE